MRLGLSILLLTGSALAQNQVQWSMEISPAAAPPGSKVVARLQAQIAPGWHLYSLSTPPGPIPTTIKLGENGAVQKFRIFQPKPERKFDPTFKSDTETYLERAVFLLEVELRKDAAAGPIQITAEPRYQVCSDKSCIPPVTKKATASLNIDSAAQVATVAIPAGYTEVRNNLPRPSTVQPSSEPIGTFLAIAFGFGLASIFTPCVFPMIPITMSFFLNQQNATRRDTIFQAGVFCLGIVVLFTALGLVATSLLGPIGVVQLGSSPWVNSAIAIVFLIFGLSLLGAFEITIPSSLLTKLDSASRKGGILGTLLMGLTFSLASFACVGPFVGTLLAASVQSGGTRPLFGMLAFATGLALPFFLLALFPAYLKRLPKSGGWLARVKVVMGFVVLAAMLKYVSNVDQVLGWGILTRERFLAAWIVLFTMAGLYLLGFLRMEGVSKDDSLGLGRLLTGMAFLMFAITLIPGMFGGKLGELDAYVPVPSGGGFGIAGAPAGSAVAWLENDLPGALDRARKENKLVLVNFTGYACTNCHWMKANMFTRPEIAAVLKNFVLVDLYTDCPKPACEANQQLEQSRFATIAIPFYAIFDPDEKVIATFPTSTRDATKYLAFLNSHAAAPTAAVSATPNPLETLPLTTLEGTAFNHAALKGKVVVLNFWATWCVPCRREIPEFNRMNEQLSAQGVAILGISMDEGGAGVIKPFLAKNPIRYTVALGDPKLNDQFQLSQLPVTVVFDRAGKSVQRFEGYTKPEEIESAIRQALKT